MYLSVSWWVMQDTVFRMRLMVLFLLILGAALVWTLPLVGTTASQDNLLVHFLDVGQGDAIFIQTSDGVEVLIDGGANNSVLRGLAKYMSFFDREINMVIGTHPDSDHIGGLIDVLKRYKVNTILRTGNTGESAAWHAYSTALQQEGAQIITARSGQQFILGNSGVVLKVLYPEYDVSNIDSNASSIVVQLVYGDTKLLLTGDSPKRIEEYLVMEGVDVQSDVLKAGHHGSRTSTSELFLEAVNPQYAVISAGKNNRYGHPHVEVTDMLFNHHIETYNTAEEGTITFESNGVEWINIHFTPIRP